MPVFLLILVGIVLGDIAWLWLVPRRLPRLWMRVTARVFGALQLGGLLAIIVSRRAPVSLEDFVPRWGQDAIFIWHLLLVLPWIVVQLVRGLGAAVRRLAGSTQSPVEENAPPSLAGVEDDARGRPALGANRLSQGPAELPLTRREFLTATAAFTPPLLALGGAAVAEGQLDGFRVRRMDLVMEDLPAALDGLTIAHVSDIHVGRFTHGRVLEEIVAQTNALDADIVALTGDLINDTLRAMPAAVDLVRALRARRMIAMCEGNHDLIDNPREFYRQAEAGGLPLLRNEAAGLTVNGQRVQILGLPWAREGAAMERDARALLARRDSGAWPLVLAHHPHAWDHLPEVPLTLSGHTHGGQLMLTEKIGFGPWLYRYWSGAYRRGDEALVVSNGTGNWFPLRIHAPAEILHLTLRRGRGGAGVTGNSPVRAPL